MTHSYDSHTQSTRLEDPKVESSLGHRGELVSEQTSSRKRESSLGFEECYIWHVPIYNPTFLTDLCDSHSCKDYRHVLADPVIKHHDQRQLKGGSALFQLIACSPSFREVGAGTPGRSQCRGHGGTLLTGLLPKTCSACFLYTPGPSAQGYYRAGLSHISHQG